MPSRSPTTRFSCAAATRTRVTGTGYGDGPRDWPVGGRALLLARRARDRRVHRRRRPTPPRARGAVERFADAAPDAAHAARRRADRAAARSSTLARRVPIAHRSRDRRDPRCSTCSTIREFASARDPEACRARSSSSSTAARADGGDGAACAATREATRVPAHRAARPARRSPTSPRSARELATLADGCLARGARARRSRRSRSPIIGMGKLGGTELNYASDVDVLFVHDGDGRGGRPRRAVRCSPTMTTPTADGIVFRTDADLRPEGRAGALSRTVDSYEAWYDAVGAPLGVPGAHQGATRSRATPTSATSSWRRAARSCGATSSTPTRSAKSAR